MFEGMGYLCPGGGNRCDSMKIQKSRSRKENNIEIKIDYKIAINLFE